MDDKQMVAAILTLALHTAERESAQKAGAERWQKVWNDYNKFLKELEKSDQSIDKRGIHPD